jgi:hypothetical protein
MSGQPTPPLLVEAFALNAPTCTPASPVAGGRTSPFPVPSQTGITPGAASLNDGFPPATMTSEGAGGVPPFGVDMNGILNTITAHLAFLAAGQQYAWSSALETAMTGYAAGAMLQQAADPNAFWINLTAGNTTDPDTASPLGSTGWWSSKPLNVVVTAGGNDIALPGASDYIYDVDATSGAINITGFVPGRDGQTLTVRKVDSGVNTVTLASLTGSAAGHQLQIVAAGILLSAQYSFATLRFNSTVNAWVQVG